MSKKTQQILRYLVILFAVLVLATILYRIYQIQQEKRDFAKAEQSIDSLALQIEQLIGKPDETSSNKSCGYANRVYGNGPLGCSVSTSLNYKTEDHVHANAVFHQISEITKAKIYDQFGRKEVTEFTPDTDEQSFSQPFPASGKFDCSTQYAYQPELALLTLHLSCGGQTISKVYPVD